MFSGPGHLGVLRCDQVAEATSPQDLRRPRCPRTSGDQRSAPKSGLWNSQGFGELIAKYSHYYGRNDLNLTNYIKGKGNKCSKRIPS